MDVINIWPEGFLGNTFVFTSPSTNSSFILYCSLSRLTLLVQSSSLLISLFVSSLVMQSLAQEIHSFPRERLRKQCTRVTTLSGRRIIETWKGSTITVLEDPTHTKKMLGYVLDTSFNLRVGTVLPYLLLGEM